MQTHTQTQTHTHKHTYTHTYTHKYISTLTHTNTHLGTSHVHKSSTTHPHTPGQLEILSAPDLHALVIRPDLAEVVRVNGEARAYHHHPTATQMAIIVQITFRTTGAKTDLLL